MENFNYTQYMKDNPLLKETSGYGNYTQPETMLEDDNEYQSAEEFDLDPQDGENDPLGPDEELMEGNPRAEFNDALSAIVAKAKGKISKSDIEQEFKWALSDYEEA